MNIADDTHNTSATNRTDYGVLRRRRSRLGAALQIFKEEPQMKIYSWWTAQRMISILLWAAPLLPPSPNHKAYYFDAVPRIIG